jgi:outer membrane receptor protein involved in Fe transport
VKGFGLDINAYVQYSSSDAVNVPLLAFKASPYYIFNVLRGKLKIQIGMDLMYNTLYYADGYDPVLHQFYCQRDMKVGNYPYWDVNLTMRIKRISFFFRAGHVLAGVIGQNYYLTPDYPAMGRSFQLGINWRFYD